MRTLALLLVASLPLLAAADDAGTTLTVHWGQERQVIDGFGACSAWYADEIANFPEETRAEIIETLFGTERGIGCSILRIRIPPDHYPEDEKAWQWDDPKLKAQCAFIKLAMAAGPTTLFASPWSPPAWMKDSGTTKTSGRLKDEHYSAYAGYLAEFIKGLKEHHGVTVDVLSLQNESDEKKKWECCVWKPEEQIRFLTKHLQPRLERDGIDVDLLAPENTMWNDHFKRWAKKMLADPATAKALDIVGGHRYRKPAASPFPEVAAAGKRLWMTEYYWEGGGNLAIANARCVHRFLVKAEVNAYLFWWLFAKPKKGGRQMLLQFDDEKKTYKVLPQAWAFGNYSRFVRPGYRRVATAPADGSVGGALVSAFRSPAGDRLVVVAINPGKEAIPLKLSLPAVTVKELAPHRSAKDERLTKLPAVAVTEGSAALELKPESVTTWTAAVASE